MSLHHLDRTICNSICSSILNSLNNDVQRIQTIGECLTEKILSPKERACKNYYITNIIRDRYGRYIMKLPFKETTRTLGDNFRYNLAIERFSLLKRFLEKKRFNIKHSTPDF
jgi:hypothetical protein